MPARKFMPMIVGALLAMLIIPAVSASGNPPAPANRAKVTVFRNIKVFDGARWPSPCTVVVQGDKITAVGSDIKVPKAAEVISGDGLALLPGLIDSHAHVSSLQDLRHCARFGVTSVMDMMAPIAFVRQVKTRLKKAEGGDMADFRSAGTAAVCPGGHGTEWGSMIPTLTQAGRSRGLRRGAPGRRKRLPQDHVGHGQAGSPRRGDRGPGPGSEKKRDADPGPY